MTSLSLTTQHGNDEIFYGSVPVHFKSVPGKAVPYIHADYSPCTIRDSNGMPTTTLARKDEIPHPDNGPPIVVPCMPCLDQKASKSSNNLDAWPDYLKTPLIKTSEVTLNEPKAFASGTRSACIKLNNTWYRLKGSGNNDQGFPIKTSKQVVKAGQPPIETRQIRGAAFIHTAICENYYSTELARNMDQHNVYGTNGSMGYYVYGGSEELPLGLSSKEFQTACIVETTRGDRRFGTHVLAGLTLLLPDLIDEAKLNENVLLTLFPSERKEYGQVPFASNINFFEDDQVKLLTTGALFGHAQLKCGNLFMSRPVKGKAATDAWTTLKNMIDVATAAAAAAAAATATATATVANSNSNSNCIANSTISVFDLQEICKVLCTSRLVGTETNVAELIGIDSGIFGSWMWNDYKGDFDVYTPTLKMLLQWRTNDKPMFTPKSIQEQLPVVSRDLLAASVVEASSTGVSEMFANASHVPDSNVLPKQFFNDKNTGLDGEKEADPRWTNAWKETCDCISNHNNNGKKESALMYVYSRLGYECGKFAKLLHSKCQTSWGTYQDKICHESGWHCNAHANNMAVMAPGNSEDTYLSYLDLDMAFDAKTVVDVKPSSDTFGKVGQTREEFGLLLAFEHFNFMEVVAGNDSSTGVPPIAKDAVKGLSKTLQIARTVLYDTMLNGYMHAYYDENNDLEQKNGETKSNNSCHSYSVVPFDKEMHEVGMALIKLAIIKQADYLA